MGTVGRNVTPTNVSDGFYYVPFLQTLEVVLNNVSVFNEVNEKGVYCMLAHIHQY